MPQSSCHRDEATSAAPWYSPGLVNSKEVILRTIFDPHHIENGKLSKAALTVSDLSERGWSVDRKFYTSRWRLWLEHKIWWFKYHRKNPKLKKCFLLPVKVADIRALNNNGIQLLSVVDWSLLSNPAHAAVILSSRPARESDARKVRTTLMGILPSHSGANQAFDIKDQFGFSRGIVMIFWAIVRSTIGYISASIIFARRE